MLEKDVILQEDAIENIFCKEMEKVPCHPMSDELAKIFIKMIMIQNPPEELVKEISATFPYQLICKRLEVMYSYDLDFRTKFFLICLTDGIPGKLVMYLTYLQYLAKRYNVNEIDFDFFGTRAFPHGYPSDEDMSKLWSIQKVKASPDNLVDHVSALKSIL